MVILILVSAFLWVPLIFPWALNPKPKKVVFIPMILSFDILVIALGIYTLNKASEVATVDFIMGILGFGMVIMAMIYGIFLMPIFIWRQKKAEYLQSGRKFE